MDWNATHLREQLPEGAMDAAELTCPNCGSVDGPRGVPRGRALIQLTCDDCGHSWPRVPGHPCPRCGSADVIPNGYPGWAFDDVEEARDDPMAPYHDVDWATFTCRKCHYDWKTGTHAG